MKKLKISAIAIIGLLFISMASASFISNSEDWKDVHATIQHASHQDESSYFTRTSSASALFNEVPPGNEYTVIESQENPFLRNLDNQLETRGITVEEVIEVDDATTELLDEDTENLVITPENDPSASLPATTLARSINGSNVIASEDNLDDVEEAVQQREGEVILVGQFPDGIYERLEVYSDEEILESNRFNMSVQVAERIEQEEEFSTVIVADGETISSDLGDGENPVLLTGTNFLADEIEEYIVENENIEAAEFIGPQMGGMAQRLSNNADSEGRDIGVFVKFGTATPGQEEGFQQEVGGLRLFGLPTADLDLTVSSAQFIPDEDMFIAGLTNQGGTGVYASSLVSIIDNEGDEIDTVADGEPQFIPAGTTEIITYDLNIDREDIEPDGVANFTTSYGGSPDTLNEFIESQEEGIFEPPRSADISIIDLEDDSNVSFQELRYVENREEFVIDVENVGEVESFVRADMIDLEIDGIETSLASETAELSPEDIESLTISASLDEEDIQNNQEIDLEINYGEFDDFLIKTDQEVAEMEVTTERSYIWVVVVILVILLLTLAYYIYRQKKKNSYY